MGLPEKNLGLWDYILFEIGIIEISFEIGVGDIKSNQIVIFHPCKLRLLDFTLFEIGIMGLQDPRYGGPTREPGVKKSGKFSHRLIVSVKP